MLIVTLSSIPPRFGLLQPTLRAILGQTSPADRVILYIPRSYRRFPEWDGTLPQVPDGVEIRRTDLDLGPATKVLPAVQDFAKEDVDILFCDDDRGYPPNWIAAFRRLREAHPDEALALVGCQAETMAPSEGVGRRQPRAARRWRSTDWRFQAQYLWHQLRAGRSWREVPAPKRRVTARAGYVDIFEGCGGVMVQPYMFDAAAFDIPSVLWAVDDVWLSGMVTKNGVPIWLDANHVDPPELEAYSKAALAASVIDGADRATANAMAVKYMQDTYGIWA